VPIPAFSCESCNKFLITDEIIETAAALIAAKGSDAWWETPSEEILPAGAVCDCGGAWVKETDIMDVWFDSGSSHAAVMKARPYLGWPADLYIEGNDQFRGWFQSSLLTSMIAYGQPPYRAVICHGMIIDEEARKMSKSLGNGIPPEDIVRDYGADILRLWVSSTDYTADVKISKDLLKQIGDIYLKVRNTARFILGNLSDYQPCRGELCSPACNGVTGTWKDTQCTPLQPLDKYILSRYNDLVKTVRAAYDNYEFHLIFHAVHNFCVIDLSNFYLDIIKDLLYCDAKNAPSRRGAQRAMYTILHGMTRLLAPILAFTSEEIWDALPHRTGDPSRALLAGMPSFDPTLALSEDAATRWVSLRSDRAMVNQALEEARAAGIIGKALDAEVVINAPSTLYPYYERNLEELRKLCIVSSMKIQPAAGEVSITVAPAPGRKCARCWVYAPDVGTHKLPDLCARCFDVVEAPV
jgi:isoleucyl-tRNA synthetase